MMNKVPGAYYGNSSSLPEGIHTFNRVVATSTQLDR
jgi:hypothetical protein